MGNGAVSGGYGIRANKRYALCDPGSADSLVRSGHREHADKTVRAPRFRYDQTQVLQKLTITQLNLFSID